MNVLLIHHSDFRQHAIHIYRVATGLAALGCDVAVAVPARAETLAEHGPTKVRGILHSHARSGQFGFADGRGPDIVHAWTPRELIRELTEYVAAKFLSPYVVHLEDNEQAVTEDELFDHGRRDWSGLPASLVDVVIARHRSHPTRARRFLEGAAGATVLIEKLAEHVPPGVPHHTFWPGFDPAFASPPPREAARRTFGLADDEVVLVYNGNIHWSNLAEIRSLAVAADLVRRAGTKVRLLRTGLNHAPVPWEEAPGLRSLVLDLGFLPRAQLPALLAAADVLVQPGESNRFNDYRFPSKLPEFLVVGRPVVLPATNLGLHLRDGQEALLLHTGRPTEIAEKILRVARDRTLARRLGEAGRRFALDRLSWDKNVPPILDFYRELLRRRRPESSAIDAPPATGVRGAGKREPADVSPRAGATPAIAAGDLPVKPIAFYLPQFHPIPENDAWWGPGFTEWTNVTRAQPNFKGHFQPILPAELGFYDLRLPEVMQRQAQLAREHGIFGFCYYYYWFSGKRLLERPLDQMLASGRPDFPFCLCWANENWTRRWDGADDEILMRQEYSPDADERFLLDVLPFLKDPRYIRVNGEPILLVYRVNLLPEPARTAELWKRLAREHGLPGLHLLAVQSFGITDPRAYGFDGAVEFPPHTPHQLVDLTLFPGVRPDFEGYLEDYGSAVRERIAQPPADHVWYRGVMPGWDNTARKQTRAHIYVNSSPAAYQAWLRFVVAQALQQPGQAPFVFINAWNEWAEGAHLEPDTRYGRGNLDATLRGIAAGIADDCRRRGLNPNEYEVARNIQIMGGGDGNPPASAANVPPAQPAAAALSAAAAAAAVPGAALPPPRSNVPAKTSAWFDDAALDAVSARYAGRFPVAPLAYSVVSDFADSLEHLRPLATHNGDLKDIQRPWMLKAILGQVPRGSRVLEIGAGEPFVGDILQRLGYDVWIVDPYDGSGNGPVELERYQRECPKLHFVRDLFSDRLDLEPQSFDCVYSISVLEHVPTEAFAGVFAGLRKFLKPRRGLNLHVIDHVHKGFGDADHLAKLRLMVEGFGLDPSDLDRLLERQMPADTETYYLSAESHNRWRGGTPYEQFPMRVCVSVQVATTEEMISASHKRTYGPRAAAATAG